MVFENPKIKKIIEYYKEIWAIDYAESLLSWDSETYMPKEAASERGLATGKLETLKQKLLLNEEFKNLVKEAEKEKNLNDYEKGVIRVLKRDIEIYEKLPPEFIEEFEKTVNEAKIAWREAKIKSDFNLFKPYLEKIVELSRKKAEYLGYDEHPYDALLDLFEEGLRTKDVERMFSEIKDKIKKIYKKILESPEYQEKHPLEEEKYEKENMKKLNLEILKILGYNFNRGRLDESAHPFTEGIGIFDVRITTWYHGKDFRRSLLATVHEFGHALYDMQIDERLMATPLAHGVSLGVHESQSRFWENIIGRSLAFVETFYDLFKQYLPFLEKYSVEDVYKYFNLVRPELIRVEADEVTYNLHIILRFEIEKGLIEGSIDVNEVREVWNEKMKEYIGREPEKDSEGVLQDIHWSLGYIGYFPTYSIGTILSAQIKYCFEKEVGNLDEIIREKKFDVVRNWLREKIHKWGKTYDPKTLIKKALGEEMNPEYFVKHIKEKYLAIYK